MNYMRNTQTPKLSSAEIEVLFDIMHSESRKEIRREARKRLYNHYIGIVNQTIRGYGHPSLERDDFKNTAAIAVGEALDTFDPVKNASFFTHATWKIRGKFSNLLKGSDLVRIPYEKKHAGYKYSCTSLNTPLSDDEEDCETMIDMLALAQDNVENKVFLHEKKGRIAKLLSALHPREREIVIRFYGLENRKQEQQHVLAEEFGVTRARIGQIVKAAEKKMATIAAKNILTKEDIQEILNFPLSFLENGNIFYGMNHLGTGGIAA